jgi:signal peptidase I
MAHMSERAETAPRPPKRSVYREYFESLAVAFILALFIRTFIVQAFKIPSGSMMPNLLIGDHLLVNKLIYSPSAGWGEDLVSPRRTIRRGDVIVFKYPEDTTKDFIKRVIGLPGETVEIRERVVYVDGKPLDEPYAHFTEPLVRRSDPAYGFRGSEAPTDWGPKKIPSGKLLVLGDNRDNSRDGRAWGLLPIENVKGRALLIYWSYDATREEYQRSGLFVWLRDTLAALGKTRWRRFFHIIR